MGIHFGRADNVKPSKNSSLEGYMPVSKKEIAEEMRKLAKTKRLAKKEGLNEEWIGYVFDLIFVHFADADSFKCEECEDFKSKFCKGGNFPKCFIEQARQAKEKGLKPSDLVEFGSF